MLTCTTMNTEATPNTIKPNIGGRDIGAASKGTISNSLTQDIIRRMIHGAMKGFG
jgi:hypothetical protein